MIYRYTDVPSLIQGDLKPDEAVCYRCGGYPVEFHHCLTGSRKKASERIGAWVWLCPKCHRWAHDSADGVRYLRGLKKECQEAFERSHSRREWMLLAHHNYMEE